MNNNLIIIRNCDPDIHLFIFPRQWTFFFIIFASKESFLTASLKNIWNFKPLEYYFNFFSFFFFNFMIEYILNDKQNRQIRFCQNDFFFFSASEIFILYLLLNFECIEFDIYIFFLPGDNILKNWFFLLVFY